MSDSAALSGITPFEVLATASKREPNSPKKTSQKKVEANRRNALRSTGPKTERGKRTVSRNAVTHGLLAKEVVITGGNGAENQEEFVQLLVAFRKDYQRIGIREELLVQRIANCYWRLARALRFEMGETRKCLDRVVISHTLQKSDETNRNVALLEQLRYRGIYESGTSDDRLSIRERFEVVQKLQSALRIDPIGVDYLRSVLEVVKTEIQEKSRVSSDLLDGLTCAIGFCDSALIDACSPLAQAKNNDEKDVAPEQKTAEKELALRLLDERLDLFELVSASANEVRILELDAQARSLALPYERATERVIRYEAHLDRQLYRAMDQLERLQRRRKGENVPPPLNINWGGRRVFAKQSQ